MNQRRLLVATSLALLLAGCGSFGGRAEEQVYVLHAPAAAAAGSRVEATLQLLRPVAQPGLDTARIAVAQPGNRLDYFAGGRWAGSLEQVAESLFAQALRGSGRFAQVASDGAGMGADFVLAVTLRRFELDYTTPGGAPTAKVVLECTLSSRREHRQLAGFDVAAEAPAAANRLGSAVAALEHAAQDASRQMGDRAAAIAALALEN
jgi:ABC-type uncharacterized transport system auxiliary subunit